MLTKLASHIPIRYWGHRAIDLPVLLKWEKVPRGTRVLEVGCGSGKISRYLVDRLHCKTYTGVDISPQMIAQAEAGTHRDTRLIFQVADAQKLPFDDGSFDAVIVMDLLHHLKNWKKAVREIHRVLKDGGKFLLKDYSIETFALPGLGHFLQNFLDHPYEAMYNQVELLSFIRKNGFAITHQNDSAWMMLLTAVKTADDRPSEGII
ncbi:MAG: class I SAM-dependent methyltransferase [Deltaproteobacteria bacterium]|nr:class I SAM-dependent methyltransferase [Deltaproteobacteria bacterium]